MSRPPGASRRAVAAILKTLILLVVAVTAAVLIFGITPVSPVALFARTYCCTLGQSIRDGVSGPREQRDSEERAARAIRLLRSEAGFTLWQTPLGEFWSPAADESVLVQLIGEQERDIYAGVRRGDVVLDCGAHIGVFTRKALREGAGLVVAIEPAPRTLECLRRNFTAEIAAGKVIVCPLGVWDRDSVLHMTEVEDSISSHVLGGQGQGALVELTTIDKLARKLGLSRVDFIKMDIEGAERNALRGARQTLAAYRPRLAIAGYHMRDDAEAIRDAVASSGVAYGVSAVDCRDWQKHARIAPQVMRFTAR